MPKITTPEKKAEKSASSPVGSIFSSASTPKKLNQPKGEIRHNTTYSNQNLNRLYTAKVFFTPILDSESQLLGGLIFNGFNLRKALQDHYPRYRLVRIDEIPDHLKSQNVDLTDEDITLIVNSYINLRSLQNRSICLLP